jgi:ABC-type polysaccharide/polyol phosphate transport system ATPase subunit
MSANIVIRARDIGKRYFLGTHSERTVFKSLRLWLAGERGLRERWALRGVSFDVRAGECLGVIGPNGAGKTTLLMLLAGILKPTEGSLEMGGDIHPFLGLSSALQPELDVEDNIRLCAALLGLPRAGMDKRLESIIEFGGLQPYRNSRLLELSSGYKMRVAYATAISVESDILLIDESMAVGDADFQAKCQEVFDKSRKRGKTIIMTSHSPAAVQQMCDRAIYLHDGRAVADGAPAVVAKRYQESYDAA